jgi:flavin prenyltransferase
LNSQAEPSAPRVVLAITGASGGLLGLRALEMLREAGVETHLVISAGATLTLALEANRDADEIKNLADFSYEPDNLAAPIASGSFQTHGMLVLPCSIKTLSAIANSYTANLVARAADVCLKEGRPLVLGVREAPFHRGHLRLMDLAARSGAVIFPPIPLFYGAAGGVDDLLNGIVGRMLLRLGIDNPHYPRWNPQSNP